MTVTATQKYIRITPRKLRLVADAVRGKQLSEINEFLTTLNKSGARVINETIRQAVANAVNNMGFSEQQLSLQSLMVNEGPTYKRFRAGARGRAKPILKRTAHVMVTLNVAEAEKSVKTEKKATVQKAEAVVSETKDMKAAEKKTAAKKAPVKKAAPKKSVAKAVKTKKVQDK